MPAVGGTRWLASETESKPVYVARQDQGDTITTPVLASSCVFFLAGLPLVSWRFTARIIKAAFNRDTKAKPGRCPRESG